MNSKINISFSFIGVENIFGSLLSKRQDNYTENAAEHICDRVTNT